MTTREGSLERPTRHPIDWRNPQFFDQESLDKELERVFDICHGCRRCVSLCGSFPTLFDLIDEGKTGEMDGVAKADYMKVVDQCYLCDLCYLTKCPYVPPHPWNVDFPHLMLRAKAKKFADGNVTFRDKLLTGTDRLGKLATAPGMASMVNAINASPGMRKVMESKLGVAAEAALPTYAKRPFRSRLPASGDWPVRDGQRTPGKVAIFTTCYVNYNEPGIGHDLVKLLAHNEIPFRFLQSEVCCGMPKLELGDLAAVEELMERNLPDLLPLVTEGYAILTPVPSCTLMWKQELPLMFPEREELARIAKAMFDPFEYLVARDKDGLVKREFSRVLGKVSYHVPCHSRVQNVGQKTREALQWVPGTEINTVERCAGHDGTYGVKAEFFAESMRIGKPVFARMAEPDPDYVSSDCPIAGRRIMQGMEGREGGTRARKEHPLTLLRIAYGLD